MSSLRKILISGLGTGYLPLAPGSWGAAAVCGIFLAASWGSGGCVLCTDALMVALAAAAGAICVCLGPFAEQAFGRKDPRRCTADEWVGQALTLVHLPGAAGWGQRLSIVGVAFFLFRLFDTIKPAPGRRLERLPHGWGALLDDVVAGIYANLAAQLLLRLWLLKFFVWPGP